MKLSRFKMRRTLCNILAASGTVLLALALVSLLGLCVSSFRYNVEWMGVTVLAFTASLSSAVLLTMIADLINPN